MSDQQPDLPAKYKHKEASERWSARWAELGVNNSRPWREGERNFVIDSPPPTVSGSLHLGHIFSYTHQDIIARQRRMNGYNVVYPMGWDDNGLPTERRVQNYFNVRVDLSQPWIENLDIEAERKRLGLSSKQSLKVSRGNFIELCKIVTRADEAVFEELFRQMCYSIDWSYKYTTVSNDCRTIAQYSFIDLFDKGHIYLSDAPTMWDTDFQTAVAQAEVEDRREQGLYHHIRFGVYEALNSGDATLPDSFEIATSRPELLAACVGVAAHPDDKRYRGLFGKHAITPCFFAKVPIFPSTEVEMDKGSGIMMVCTFGDQMDVQKWRENNLELRQMITPHGKIAACKFGDGGWDSLQPEAANANYGRIENLNLKAARKAMAEILGEGGNSALGDDKPPLVSPPEPMTHSVRYFEKGNRPLEYLSQRQWFTRLLEHKQALIDTGRKINWHPEFMYKRFENWTMNLNTDWCISRQRYFGVPIPVWYPLDGDGMPDFNAPIVASESDLPVDPITDTPRGYSEEQRNQPNGFTSENDVFDTWFTSSLTPQIVARWNSKEDVMERLFPMDLRPQSHEIIRTWAFYTIAKSLLHHKEPPWRNIIISGWILDPERKKMSKSRGNVVVPTDLLEQYGSDALRYWAGKARLGVDISVDDKEFKVGSKLVTKLFNASKFVLRKPGEGGPVSAELDKAFLYELYRSTEMITRFFEEFEFALALKEAENAFWNYFTDDYLELVKTRAWDENVGSAGYESALTTLRAGLAILLRIFAPFLPVITEEIWSWDYAKRYSVESIHSAPWPFSENEFADIAALPDMKPESTKSFTAIREAIGAVRKAKTMLGVSVGSSLKSARIIAPPDTIKSLQPVVADLAAGSRVEPEQLALVADEAAKECRVELELLKQQD